MDSGPRGSLSFCAFSDSKAAEKGSVQMGRREAQGWGQGVRERTGGPGFQRTHLPAVHVQQDHVPHIVSRDHHSASGRHIQAAKPDAGGRNCAIRLLGTEARSLLSLL